MLNLLYYIALHCIYCIVLYCTSIVLCSTVLYNNNNDNNLYLGVKAKIAVTEPLNGDTIYCIV